MKKALDINSINTPRDMRRTILRLVWPVVIQNLLMTLHFITDRAMVGRLGEVALSAVGIAGPMLWSISMVLMAVGIGTMAAVARAIGEGDTRKAQANAATGLFLSLIGGVANNAAIVDVLNKHLGVELIIPENPQYVGALGAALVAAS